MLILVIVVVVLIAGFVGYRALMRDSTPKQVATPEPPVVEAASEALPEAEDAEVVEVVAEAEPPSDARG